MDTKGIILDLRIKHRLSQEELAETDFILACACEENGENPELIVYKKR